MPNNQPISIETHDSAAQSKVYRPSIWQSILNFYAPPFAAYLLIWIAGYAPEILHGRLTTVEHGASQLLAFAAGLAVLCTIGIGIYLKWFVIRIDSTSISTRESIFKTKSLLLSQIDRPRTQQQSKEEKRSGAWTIWDINGERLYIPKAFFSRQQVAEILTAIGCDQEI